MNLGDGRLPGLVGLLPVLIVFATAMQEPTQTEDPYVGNEICQACHDEPVFEAGPHAEETCEGCHGPGLAHVEAGGDDSSMRLEAHSTTWLTDQCSRCHTPQVTPAAFNASQHGTSAIGCADCHRTHAPEARRSLLIKAANDLCSDCHRKEMASFRKPYGHPVAEGAMQCAQCHDPHQDSFPRLMRASHAVEEGCVSCHADKQGPFVFEHLPQTSDGCVSCHESHGSVNPKLLRRSQIQQLCLECHSTSPGVAGTTPFAFHDMRSPRFRNCSVCHREIHGSNVSHTFLR